MGKKLIAAVALVALLAASVGSALATAGSSGDPLVTLSYLTNTYIPQTEQAMLERAQAAAAATEQAAFARLDALADSYLAQAGGGESADVFLPLTLARDDCLKLPAGASVLFKEGMAQLLFLSGCLVDVTEGQVLTDGSTLTAGHRYVAAEDTVCSITAVSDAVYLLVRGGYTLDSTGKTYTPFTDLKQSDWYYPYAAYAYERGLITGVTTTTFCPETYTNRAMLAIVLSRLVGADTARIPSVGFSDVADSDWYAKEINWAASVGIVTGTPENTYEPMSYVTREQMAAMFYRCAGGYLGLDVSTSGDLSAFTDADRVSPYAVEALTWAVEKGIMTGMTNTTLVPNGTATRAQVATMLQRFSNLI